MYKSQNINISIKAARKNIVSFPRYLIFVRALLWKSTYYTYSSSFRNLSETTIIKKVSIEYKSTRRPLLIDTEKFVKNDKKFLTP
jgi:hypothetical protein